MNDHDEDLLSGSGEPDPVLIEVTDEISERLQAGEEINVRDYVRRYPQWAGAILKLLPTIHDLVAYGPAIDGDRRGERLSTNPNNANGYQLPKKGERS